MARNYYSEIHLHLVWHTKESTALLTPRVEAVVHHYLRHKLSSSPGIQFHAVGGIETHVHSVISIAPTVLISDLVGKLKGGSSHEANQKLGGGRKLLEWQGGYGVVSFGTQDLPWIIDYVLNQRERHARQALHDRLERIDPETTEAEAGTMEEAP